MSTTTTSKTTIDIRGLSPLILVFDIQRSLLFYCDVLGFELVSSDNSGPDYGWVLLSSGKTELMMEPIYPKDQSRLNPMPYALRITRILYSTSVVLTWTLPMHILSQKESA
jgi:hypothetical protein